MYGATSVKRLALIGRRILLGTLSSAALLGSASGAWALYLDCKVPGMENALDAGFYLNVDYAAPSVALIGRRELTSTPAYPARVSDTRTV